MAFNSYAYRANTARRAAWANLLEARRIKERVAAGVAYDWEADRVEFFVKLARLEMRDHLNWRRLRDLQRSYRGRA